MIIYRVTHKKSESESGKVQYYTSLALAKNKVELQYPSLNWNKSNAHGEIHYYGSGFGKGIRDHYVAYIESVVVEEATF